MAEPTFTPQKYQFLVDRPGRTAENTLLLAHPKLISARSSHGRPLIVWSQSNTHYYLFNCKNSVQAFQKWAISKPEEERTYCEVIFGHEKQRMKLDIDGEDPPDPTGQILFAAIRRAWSELSERIRGNSTGRFLLFWTSGDGSKPHMHVLIDCWVNNVGEAKSFAESVARHAPHAKIDLNVYNSIQNFRILGCHKPASDGSRPINKMLVNAADQKFSLADVLVGHYS